MIQITAYTIIEHPAPQKVYKWIRNNWHDLSEHSVNEAIDSLKGMANHFDLHVDYSISAVEDRGEYIKFEHAAPHYNDITDGVKNYTMPDLPGNCPFTGICWDENLCDVLRKAKPNDSMINTLNMAGKSLLNALHSDTGYTYSDEGLKDLCDTNEYHFFENGSIA